ncbi:MAG: transposase [Cyanobacteriota bacterium]
MKGNLNVPIKAIFKLTSHKTITPHPIASSDWESAPNGVTKSVSKIVGSSNYTKAQLRIARLHRKIANIRKDTLHKLTTYISKKHAVIGLDSADASRVKQEENGNVC